MEIIVFPHAVIMKMKYNNVCDVSFLLGIIQRGRVSQLDSESSLDWSGHI